MRVRVDHGADAVYLNLTDRPIKDSEEVADGIVVDYDFEGRIVGVEILDASKRTDDPAVLKQFSFELPTIDAGGGAKRGHHMANERTLSRPELDDRIAILRDNLRQLTEQAAALSGAGDEARIADRIAEQEAELDRLTKQRDALGKT